MPTYTYQRADGAEVLVDVEEHTLTLNRTRVKFTPIEWQLFETLFLNIGETVNREDLLASISEEGDHTEDTRTVDVHISSIRKKLDQIKFATIKSDYGKGYVLVFEDRP